MTGIVLRVIVFAIIGIAIWLGVRKIWRDWTNQFKSEDEEAKRLRRERDLRERAQPGVIDLKRDEDGTFRPGDDDKRR
jgi:flagellar biosynthesis/type III secretory pathway M-ring protein FliF/YscJ